MCVSGGFETLVGYQNPQGLKFRKQRYEHLHLCKPLRLQTITVLNP